MTNQTVAQAVLVDGAELNLNNQMFMQLALFTDAGVARVVPNEAAAQADFVGADLSALKVELNAFLAKLRTADVIADA